VVRSRLRRFVPVVVVLLAMVAVFASGAHRHLSLETLVRHRMAIDAFMTHHMFAALGSFVAIYIVVVALSIPGALFLSISGGVLFGTLIGGLANIVEKALGSVAKAGSTAIRAVATHGEKVTAKGLVFAATPASDFICGTQQLASMNLHVFTTGEGSPYGLALVPVVKVSSRTALAEKWHDLIDVDAGRIATGGATIDQVGWELFRFILDVASGRRKTWAEHWKLANALAPFNPGPVT
jgi:hypothetical protein